MDVRPWRIGAVLDVVPGILQVTQVRLGLAPVPVGTSTIPVGLREIARFDAPPHRHDQRDQRDPRNMGEITHKITHAEEARARLLSQYAGRLERDLDPRLLQVQEVEDALWAVWSGRGVGTATGHTPRPAGRIVGEDRQGEADALYRIRIRPAYKPTSATGRGEDIHRVVAILPDAQWPLATATGTEIIPLRSSTGSTGSPRSVAPTILRSFSARSGGGDRAPLWLVRWPALRRLHICGRLDLNRPHARRCHDAPRRDVGPFQGRYRQGGVGRTRRP